MTRPLLGLAAVLAAAAAGSAQIREPRPEVDPTGTEVFRGLLDAAGVKPADDRALNREPSARGLILVVIGLPKEPTGAVALAESSRKVLAGGGAVLIATEDAASLADFFPDATPLSAVGERAYAKSDATCFAGKRWSPFAVAPEAGLADRVLSQECDGWFRQWPRVVTNRPSGLHLGRGGRSKFVHPIGYLPPATINGPDGQNWPTDRAVAYAGAGPASSPHRCCVVADTGVFLNQSMWAPDPRDRTRLGTDNFAFANQLVEWLRGEEKRATCVFVENGNVVPSFTDLRFRPAGSAPEPPPITQDMLIAMEQKLVDAANSKLAEAQTRDRFNRFLTGTPPADRFPQLLRGLAVFGSLALVGWLVRRAWKNRHAPDVPAGPKPAAGAATGGPLAERGAELARSADLSGPVREFVRLVFAGQGLPPGPPPRKMPRVEVTGPGAPRLRDDLRALWEVAFPARPVPLNFARWKELEPVLDAVRKAAAAGRWRFADPTAPPPPHAPGGAA